MEGAFCVCRVHRIVHEASEEGRRGGWAVRRTLRDVVSDADGEIGRAAGRATDAKATRSQVREPRPLPIM